MSTRRQGGRPAVLVLRALGLGDALTGLAPLRGIRRGWPGHRLVLAAPAGLGALLRSRGLVDEVLDTSGLAPLQPQALAALGIDGTHVAVNLHGRGPQSHRLLLDTRPERLVAFAHGLVGLDQGPAWAAAEHEVLRWCRLVSSAGGSCGPEDLLLEDLLLKGPSRPGPADGAVVVHPGAASGSRRWPVQRWREVVVALTGNGFRVAVTGSQQERALVAAVVDGRPDVLDLSGRLTLEQLLETVSVARLLLCGDTGVAHVATAVRTPSVLLFGPTPPTEWGPLVDTQLHTVLWHPRPGDAERGDPHACSPDVRLERIAVTEVLAAARQLLSRVATS